MRLAEKHTFIVPSLQVITKTNLFRQSLTQVALVNHCQRPAEIYNFFGNLALLLSADILLGSLLGRGSQITMLYEIQIQFIQPSSNRPSSLCKRFYTL